MYCLNVHLTLNVLSLKSECMYMYRMSTTEVAPETEGANLLRRNSDDVGWEYGVLVDANNKDKVKCKLCDKVMQGGIYRLK